MGIAVLRKRAPEGGKPLPVINLDVKMAIVTKHDKIVAYLTFEGMAVVRLSSELTAISELMARVMGLADRAPPEAFSVDFFPDDVLREPIDAQFEVEGSYWL